MKHLFLIFFATTSLLANLQISGNIGVNSQIYLTSPNDKNKQNFTATQEVELKYIKDDLTIYSKLYAQQDSYDLFSDEAKHNDRTFAKIEELYLKYDFEDDMLSVGKSIKFWGALEVRNIVDGFNPQDFRADLFGEQKLSVYNLTYSHFTNTAEISAIIKLDEQDQPMASYPYVYYFFPSFVSYDGKINKKDDNKLTIYLTYSGSTNTKYPLDYAFIYQNGYDSQRYFNTTTPERLDKNHPDFAKATEFKQYVYSVNKFMTYNTLVVGAMLIKLEALYAKVEDNSYVGDYSHIALGFEHTLQNIMDTNAALGLIGEYYRYDTYDDAKYGDLELFETMQNDLFLGLRYTLNNTNNTDFIGGAILDLEYDERTYYMKFQSRAYDSFKVEVNYYYIKPSKDLTLSSLTPYQYLGKHQRVGVNIAWFF